MKRFYPALFIIGLMAVPASFLIGWKYDPAAPASNYLFNLIAFMIFMAIHIIMLLPVFKKMVYKNPVSTTPERRIYSVISIVTWIILYLVHQPVPGPGFIAPLLMQYIGACIFLYGFLMFFEGVTFDFLYAFLGVPGTELSHSADASTPLMTEGSYAQVRHPMYRGALTYCFASMLIYPNAGQLLFVVLVSLGFVLFIPFEERSLIKARGDEYLEYMQVVRYRVIKNIW